MLQVASLLVQGVPCLVHCPSQALGHIVLLEPGGHAHICGVHTCTQF